MKCAVENIDGDQTPSWKQTFTFDRYGNRNFDEADTTTLPKNCGTAPNFTVCPADVPVVNPSVDPTNNRLNGYQFDDAGNTKRDAQSRKFTYDAENKQTKVETLDVNGNPVNTIGIYEYDGDGRRVKKISATEITVFVYNASGQLVADYSTNVEPAQTERVSYLTSDHLGSPRITTDRDGKVFSRRDFMPFGEEITAAQTPQRSINQNYGEDGLRQKFTSYERDDETNLDFAQARYYQSIHARFQSPNPLFFQIRMLIDPQAFNLYVYTRNNPLTLIDPDGMEFRISVRGNPEQAMDDIRRLAGDFADRVTFTKVYDDDGNLSYYQVGFELEALEFSSISEGARLIYDLVYDEQVFMGQRGGTLEKRFKPGTLRAGRIETVDVEAEGAGNITRNRPGQTGIFEPADEGVDSIFFWSDQPVFHLIGDSSAVVDPFSFMVHEGAESYLLAQGIEYNTAHGNYYIDDGRGNLIAQPRHPDNAVSRERKIHYELKMTTPRSHYFETNLVTLERINRRGN